MDNQVQQPGNEVVEASRVLSVLGLVTAFGHVSERTGSRMLITPAADLGLVTSADLIEVELAATSLPPGAPAESWVHVAVYAARPDVAAIARAQPPAAFAVASVTGELPVLHGQACCSVSSAMSSGRSRNEGISRGKTCREVQALDPNIVPFDLETTKEYMALPLFPAHTTGLLLGVFGALALVLAIGGLYGVMSYAVSQRTHEMGVRMALGAGREDIVRLVVGQGMLLTLLGIGIGLAGAFGATRALASLLYGISSTDHATFAAVSLILVGVALAASYIPARRATKVDPMVALRYE
jgi:hypothetical protein